VFLKRAIFFAVFLWTFGASLQAQVIDLENEGDERQDRTGSSILDDSTKQIYGPTTTQYYYQENIKFNIKETYPVDTSIIGFHKWQYKVAQERLYQNLGNVATPAFSIYPLVPTQIGATSGFSIFDLYWRGPDQVKFYNTLSPHSKFKIIWGGQGRALTEVNYTRNIDFRSGFGFEYRGFFIDKQIQRQGRGDRNVRGTYYNFHGNYMTKDGKYKILGSFVRNNHLVDEYGGIENLTGTDSVDIYFDENRQINLSEAENNELRTQYRIYHQYELNDKIEIYHQFDRYKQQNDFIDQLDEENNTTFFDFVEVDSADVKDRSKIVNRVNEFGVKGDLGKAFYSFYWKYREVNFQYKYLSADTIDFLDTEKYERYLGFDLRFGNDSISYIRAFGQIEEEGNFNIGGEFINKWFYAKGSTTQHDPGYIYQAYRGSHDVWLNDFDPSIITKLEAGVNYTFKGITLSSSVSNTLMSKYLYFRKSEPQDDGQTVLPVQTSADVNILSPAMGIGFKFLRNFTFNSKVIANTISGESSDAVNLPDIYARAQLKYGRISFEGNLEWQIGLDAYWKSTYFANGYDPAIMQFYVQNEFEVEAFPIVDLFVDGKINRGRFFLKLNNIYELFTDIGYFATPEYPGQTTILDFGIDWAFYD